MMIWLPKLCLVCLLLTTISCGIEARSCDNNSDCFVGESCQDGTCVNPKELLTPNNDAGTDTQDDGVQSCGPLDCQVCENGQVDNGEECDTQIPLTETCVSRGFSSGELSCSNCKINESACEVLESCAGNGLDEGELCDGNEFKDDKTCETEGFDGGELKCSAGCSLDTSACFKCGDAVKNGTEACDGTDFGGKTCATESGLVGPLSCSNDCKTIEITE